MQSVRRIELPVVKLVLLHGLYKYLQKLFSRLYVY